MHPRCCRKDDGPRDDQRVAAHEAFHALALRLCGLPIGLVTIEAGDTYEGLVSGPNYAVTRLKDDIIDAATLCDVLRPTMPLAGEDREDFADVFQSILDQCLVMTSGEIGERLLLPGEPQPALSDRRQAATLAGLICRSPQAVEQFIALAETMAGDLQRPHSFVGLALATALRVRRTMTDNEVDEVITATLAIREQAEEHARHIDWQKRQLSADDFEAEYRHADDAAAPYPVHDLRA